MTVVDACFPVIAGSSAILAVDHVYQLYAVVCKALELHDQAFPGGMLPITGQFIGQRRMAINEHSRCRLRIGHDRIPELLALAGKPIELGCQLRFGMPTIHPLTPACRLYARLVTIKGALDGDALLAAARMELDRHGINGQAMLVPHHGVAPADKVADPEARELPEATTDASADHRDPYIRRTVRIRDREVVGYALLVEGLSAADSIHLQETGLGGRRHFGCGLFVPAK